jgi:hypothetical protein
MECEWSGQGEKGVEWHYRRKEESGRSVVKSGAKEVELLCS